MAKITAMAGWNLDVEEGEENGIKFRVLVAESPEVGPRGPLEVQRFHMPIDVAEQIGAKLQGKKVDVFTAMPPGFSPN